VLRIVNFQNFSFETSVLTSYLQKHKSHSLLQHVTNTELTVPFKYFALDTKHQKTERRLKDKCSRKTF